MSERILFYKKYVREVDVEKINSYLFSLLYNKYEESLDSREGLILKECHIAYLQGLHDGLDWSSYNNDDIEHTKQEIQHLISYINKHKEVQVWSGSIDEDDEDY